MNTTAAATQAGVTIHTIRHWCRYGAITATKHAGRWIIDAASLARRIAISKEHRMSKNAAPKPVEYTIETMTAIGGNRRKKAGKDRIYLDDWDRLAGIEVSHNTSGNIASCAIDGCPIANSGAWRILAAVGKVYFDTADGEIHIQHVGDAREMDISYRNGDRETIDLVDRIHAGIRAAVAAL